MNLEAWGFTEQIREQFAEPIRDGFEPGRVVAEHKERYVVQTPRGELDAEVSGSLRFSASERADFPAVGDWVALTTYDDDFAIIHHVLPRRSVLSRQAIGHAGASQIIAANVDHALLVQAADRDFSPNRLERYLTICYAANVHPLIVLTKTDLVEAHERTEMLEILHRRIENVPILAVSNETHEGLEGLESRLVRGQTFCLLGSSGAGKSSLLNNLAGTLRMKTGAISPTNQRGRHVTTHREMMLLENGAILVDNPGMREVGLADTAQGLETTFDKMLSLAENCKFRDCSHTSEAGCAVLEAVEQGDLSVQAYENFLKMGREKARYETSVAEKRRKDKMFGKMMKDYKKLKPKQRF